MKTQAIFDHFRRQKTFDGKARSHPKVFFQLDKDEYGTFLTTVDNKGKAIETNYLAYSGAVRNLLRSVEQIQDKNAFVIDWERPTAKVYLSEHDFLIEQLRRTGNIVNAKNEALAFKSGIGLVRVLIEPLEPDSKLAPKQNQNFWKAKVQIQHTNQQYESQQFELLNENTVLVGHNILSIQPLGSNFKSLSYFDAELKDKDLPVFLSLFYSYLTNVELVWQDYKVKDSKDKVYAKPALIFEKIDSVGALFMRVGQVLPNMEVNVLDFFDLYRYAEINDIEKTISVKYVEQETIEEVINQIGKLLKRHTPKKRRGAENIEVVLEDDLFIIPEVVAGEFIYNELPQLLLQFQVFGSEKLKAYKIIAEQPGLNMSFSSGIDFLEGDVSLQFGTEKIGLFDAINQFRKNNYVRLSNGNHALINEAYLKKLERIFTKKGKKTVVSFFDLPLVEDLINEKIESKPFRKSRELYEGFNTISKKRYRLPEVKATLRPYQKNGYKWLKYIHDNKFGGCLADDMGLGKTLQTLSILATIYPKETTPSLIIMPRSLLFNWRNEVEKFTPQLSYYTYYGNSRDLAEAMKANLIFTTYALVRNDIEQFKEEQFYYVILDESQNIKNIQALTTKAVMLLQAKHRLALSGTPIENNLGELYSLFRFLNPAMFGTTKNFSTNYLTPIQKHSDKEAILQLRKKIYPFILRRLKKDVLADLPDKIEQTLYVEMSPAQKKLYEERRMFYVNAIETSIATRGLQQSKFFIFQALSELRQIASTPEQFSDGKIISPKRELLEEQLMDTLANGHKALIFVNFLAAIELIGQQLDRMGIDFVSMTGATRDRQALVDKFQNDPNCSAFLMTLKTGGTGLNLTAADTIFIFDPWWNVAAENQAIDRAHRIGQTNKVLAYKLITEGSIEEKILQLQEQKKELFDNVISADGASLKSLTEEDIDFILK